VFNPNPLFLGVELGRTLSGNEQADRKAASLSKGSRMLMALSGSDWGWSSNLLRKVNQTSFLSGATYAGGGWIPWLSATSVETLDRSQDHYWTAGIDSNRRPKGGSGIPILWLPSRPSCRRCTGKVAQTRPSNPPEGRPGRIRGCPVI
jgi:hypothetical protein